MKEENPDIGILYAKGGKPYLFSLDFDIISKTQLNISKCELKFLRIVDFNWLIKNSWKENNPNIIFKDLYFLDKLENSKYIKYKVGRTVIVN